MQKDDASRPGTASTTNSIMNMLIAKRNSMAANSHIVATKPRCIDEHIVAEQATSTVVKNIIKRCPRLPAATVEKYARGELNLA